MTKYKSCSFMKVSCWVRFYCFCLSNENCLVRSLFTWAVIFKHLIRNMGVKIQMRQFHMMPFIIKQLTDVSKPCSLWTLCSNSYLFEWLSKCLHRFAKTCDVPVLITVASVQIICNGVLSWPAPSHWYIQHMAATDSFH